MHDDRHPLPLTDQADRRRLVRAAARLLGTAEAEDAVQDAYVRALEADASALAELHAAQAWLHTVVRNLAIDRLRRRQWLQQWLAQIGDNAGGVAQMVPSAEANAAQAQDTVRALRVLAARLAPADGAAVLLYEVFEATHAELAHAGGKTEAGSRQQMRRALLRLRQADGRGDGDSAPLVPAESEEREEAVFNVYLQSLQQRDPHALWAMLGQPAARAVASGTWVWQAALAEEQAPRATIGGVVQVGGQLGLVVTLDGVRLCVVPLGARSAREFDREPLVAWLR